MNHGDSVLAHGTSGSQQLMIENQEMADKAKENETKVAEQYKYDHDEVIRAIDANDMEYLRTKLSQTSPVHIPHTAEIKPDRKKNGYDRLAINGVNQAIF